MGRKQTTGDSLHATTDDATTETPEDATAELVAAASESAAATIAATRTTEPDGANALTIVGRGAPSSFEVTVDGDIERLTEEGVSNATTVSGTTVEGTIETGTVQFRFTGELTDVTFVDRRITGLSPAAAPNVHVDYDSPEHSQS